MIIHPHQGVDRIWFGMSRVEVARAVNMVSKPSKCGIYGLEEDFFEAMGFSAMYDVHWRCNALGFARGLGTKLEYDGYQLFDHPAREVRDWALARDPGVDPTDGFTSKLLGLTMGADWIDVFPRRSRTASWPGC